MGNFNSVTEMNKARPFKFHPGNQAGVFIWEISSLVTEIFVTKTEISVTRLKPAFSYEHIKVFTKESVVRRDLRNRASPVDRAHIKRPLV